MVSRNVVDSILIGGALCGVLGTPLLLRRKPFPLPELLGLTLLWGIAGAVAPISGWLFTGVQAFQGVPAPVLNGLTYAMYIVLTPGILLGYVRSFYGWLEKKVEKGEDLGSDVLLLTVAGFVVLPVLVYAIIPESIITVPTTTALQDFMVTVLQLVWPPVVASIFTIGFFVLFLGNAPILNLWPVNQRRGPQIVGIVLTSVGVTVQVMPYVMPLLGIKIA
jgi:hypothetical protein